MPTIGTSIAIIDEKGRILLTKREDFEVWCLPGGGADFGESAAEAAIREAEEETGLKVKLTRLVGVYSRPLWLKDSDHTILYAAKAVGGKLKINLAEVIGLGFFEADNLPRSIIWWQKQQIKDALFGIVGASWKQDIKPGRRKGVTRQKLYRLRDQSDLPRQEFFSQYFTEPEIGGEKIEILGYCPDKPVRVESAAKKLTTHYFNTRLGSPSFKDRFKGAVFQSEARQNFKEV